MAKKENNKKSLPIIIIGGLGLLWAMTKDNNTSNYGPGGGPETPRGLRNNNIGNIKINPANNWLGKVPLEANTDKVYEQFTKKEYGTRAMLSLLMKYYNDYNLRTIYDIIGRYSKSSLEPGKQYIPFLVSKMGINDNEILLGDDILKLAYYMAWFENGTSSATSMNELLAVAKKYNLGS